MKRLLTLLFAMVTVLMAQSAFASIANTPHDYLGADSHGRCGVCHVPHAATTGARLWRTTPISSGTAWETSTVGSLCAGCHDSVGTQAAGNIHSISPHQVNSIFAATSHGRTWNTLTVALTGHTNGKPYSTTASMECTSCHNVHYDGTWVVAGPNPKRPFLRTTQSGTVKISNYCAECHDDRLSDNLIGTANVSGNHPVNIAYASNVATGGGGQYFKTTPDANLTHAVVSLDAWSLGGKFQDSGAAPKTSSTVGSTDQIGCQTCHAVHSPAAGTDQGTHLLAINNVDAANAALCEGCHANNDNTARANSSAIIRVGAALGDHPIDCAIAPPGPQIDRWYNGTGNNATVRAERYTVTTVNNTPNWPMGNTSNIICTSCHSAHRARSAAKLTRTNGTSTNSWCVSCHSDPSPLGHHSHSGNTGGTLSTMTSGLDCSNCHGGSGFSGAGSGKLAHNGFSFNTFASGNNASQLCNGCHLGVAGVAQYGTGNSGTDPVGQVASAAGNYNSTIPNGHLTGTPDKTMKSHYVGSFTNAANSINVKTGNWGDSTHAAYSKYGVSPDTHGAAADTTGTTVVCESCHSVLHNIGATGVGTSGGTVITPGQNTGYNNNLLLSDYQDDSKNEAAAKAVQSQFCVACHNQNINSVGLGTSSAVLAGWSVVGIAADVPAGTHPMTGWNVSVTGAALSTSATGLANAGTAPPAGGGVGSASKVSYYATNGMDCDSCHRPHMADTGSTYSQTKAHAGTSVPVILEKQAAAEEWADFCQQCHAEGTYNHN